VSATLRSAKLGGRWESRRLDVETLIQTFATRICQLVVT
jgi:hypothetical protein